jgi:hypothetical protein
MPKPEKDTPEYELWLCAIDVAIAAPWNQATHAFASQIPWEDIHKLRRALEAVDIDWQAAKKSDDEAVARVRKQHAERTAARMIISDRDESQP